MKDPKHFTYTNERVYQLKESIRIKKKEKGDVQLRLDELDNSIKEDEFEYRVIHSVIQPSITITEVTNAVGDRIFIGKYRLYIDSKPQLVTIYIGKADNFSGKDDPQLLSRAKEKALISNEKRLLAKNIHISAK